MHYIYFIKDYTAVKIGKSENVEQRKENLQTANPNELIIHRKIAIPDNISLRSVEINLHNKVWDYHKRGEWFYLNCLEILDKMSDVEIIALGNEIDENNNHIVGRKRIEEHYGADIHKKILSLNNQGLSYRKISKMLGISIATICRSIKENRSKNLK